MEAHRRAWAEFFATARVAKRWRRTEAERGKALWEEASRAGLKGEKRKQWVMGRLGWDARTDESRLRRLLKES